MDIAVLWKYQIILSLDMASNFRNFFDRKDYVPTFAISLDLKFNKQHFNIIRLLFSIEQETDQIIYNVIIHVHVKIYFMNV